MVVVDQQLCEVMRIRTQTREWYRWAPTESRIMRASTGCRPANAHVQNSACCLHRTSVTIVQPDNCSLKSLARSRAKKLRQFFYFFSPPRLVIFSTIWW